MPDRPLLEGVTVLDLASVGPAARASRWLADWGAAVVKVGPVPGVGDVQIRPPFHAYAGERGMRRLLVDLKAADGREAFLRMARTADVVVESFRPGVADRLGIGYDDVRTVNPAVVYCSVSGYGATGPARHRAGHDLDYLAVGGFLASCTPGVDGRPPLPGATVADSAAGGLHAVSAILAALVGRAATGNGVHLDVAVADGVLALMALHVDEHLAVGTAPGPGHGLLTGRYACYDVYPTADGRWLAVAAIEPRFWAELCEALGLQRWIAHQTDDLVQDEIRADLRRAFTGRTRDEWVAALADRDTCVAAVQTVTELAEDPQFAARRAFVEATHPEHGRFRQVGPVLAGMVRGNDPYVLPDPSVTATDDLLAAAGYDDAEIAKLRDAGVVA